MIEAKTRKVHSSVYKAKVGLEAIRGLKAINQIGLEYGVHPVQVSQWKRDMLGNALTLFEGRRGPKPVDEDSKADRLYS